MFKKINKLLIVFLALALCTVTVMACPTPEPKSISPNTGLSSQTVTVTIDGAYFHRSVFVRLMKQGQPEIMATIVKRTPTRIVCNFDLKGAVAGQWNVVVTTIGTFTKKLRPYVMKNAFTVDYPSPQIVSISPNGGDNASVVPLEVKGSGFRDGIIVKLSKNGEADIVGSKATVNSDASLICNLDLNGAKDGSYNVEVINDDGKTASLKESFSITQHITDSNVNTTTAGAPSSDTAAAISDGDDAAVTDEDDAAITDEDDAAVTDEDDAAITDGNDVAATDEDGAAINDGDDAAVTDEDDAAITDGDDAAVTDEDDAAITDGDDAAVTDEDDSAITDGDDAAVTDEDTSNAQKTDGSAVNPKTDDSAVNPKTDNAATTPKTSDSAVTPQTDGSAVTPKTDDSIQNTVLKDVDPNSLIKPIFFDYDRSAIRDDQAASLDQDVLVIKSNSQMHIILGGHADERGTVQYNLKLSARRAETVKKYLLLSGVDASKIIVYAYGKEHPVRLGHDESAWWYNRRVDITLWETEPSREQALIENINP